MAKVTPEDSKGIIIFSAILGVGSGLLFSQVLHWYAATGAGLVTFCVSFFVLCVLWSIE